MARSSSEIQNLLGQPLQEGWTTFVESRHVYGCDFAEWTASLKGPKGSGQLSGAANRIGSSWHYSRLMLTADDGRIVDLTPPPERDKLFLKESSKKVFLVPLGPVPEEYLSWIPAYYKHKFELNVQVLPVIPLNPSVGNATRRQLVAERLVALMKSALPKEARDQSTILLGLTSEDMFIQSYDWRYAINYREDGRFGVVSTARLKPALFFQKWNHVLALSRLQKMLTKNVYLLCFGAHMSGDDTSAVSGGVMSPEEVDYMSDEIVGAEGRWHSLRSGTAPTISMIIDPKQPTAWDMEWSAKPPTDVSTEYFAADLWAGIFIQRKTDFYLAGDFPLQFVRTYASKDVQPREFGVGTNDSLDISMAGEPNN
jgi:predicted Zn-dependent protease